MFKWFNLHNTFFMYATREICSVTLCWKYHKHNLRMDVAPLYQWTGWDGYLRVLKVIASQVELKNETLCWLETLLPDTDLFLWGSSDTNRVKICKYYFRIEWGKSQKKNVFFRALPTIWVTNLWWMSSQFLEKGDKSWHYQLQTQLYCSQGRIKDFLPECNEQYFAGKSRLIILEKISPHNTEENLTS